jgi:hypothetical protein
VEIGEQVFYEGESYTILWIYQNGFAEITRKHGKEMLVSLKDLLSLDEK